MKLIVLLALATVCHGALLGSRKCTYGPAYWCSHVDHARECGTIQHCIDRVWNKQAMIGATESCFNVIQTLDNVRHAGDADLMAQMAESCTKMTSGKRSVCKELMMKNAQEVLTLLKSDLSSAEVATALGLCAQSSVLKSQSIVRQHTQTVVKPDNYCTDCVNFFRDLQEIVNNTQAKIADTLKAKVCTKLGYFEKLCNETVDTYSNFFITALAQQLNPQDLCFLFELCADSNHRLQDFVSLIRQAKGQLHTEKCDVCQDLAKEVQNVLRDTSLQNDILSTLENNVCSLLPGDLATECKSYVSQYGSMVFEVLVAELDPITICESLGMCNGTKATARKLTRVSVPLRNAMSRVRVMAPVRAPAKLMNTAGLTAKGSEAEFTPLCTLCELVIRKVEDLVGTNATEEEIVAALMKVCSLLPDEYKADCDTFVQTYLKEIVDLLLKDVGPEAVCTALGLCLGQQPVIVKSGIGCETCKEVMSLIRAYVKDPTHTAQIIQWMDQVCEIVPASYRDDCLGVVDFYAPHFIDLINQYDDPQQVCTALTLCPNTTQPMMKGGHSATDNSLRFLPLVELRPAHPAVDCNDGPRVWCASLYNAHRCKAVDYCVEKKLLLV